MAAGDTLDRQYRTLVRVQALSGLLFAVFVLLHLGNHVAGVLGGVQLHRRLQSAFRWYYQQPLLELGAVVGAAAVHALAGVLLMYRRRQQPAATKTTAVPRPLQWHRWAAWMLLVFVPGHVLATRLAPLVAGVTAGADITFAAAAFDVSWFFYPYYTVLAAFGLYHALYGAVRACRTLGWSAVVRPAPAPTARAWLLLLALGLAVGALAVSWMSGALRGPLPVDRAGDWDRVFQFYFPGYQSPLTAA